MLPGKLICYLLTGDANKFDLNLNPVKAMFAFDLKNL